MEGSPILRRRAALHLGVTGLHVREVRRDFLLRRLGAEDKVLPEKAADGIRGSGSHKGIRILDECHQGRHALPVTNMPDALGGMGANYGILMTELRSEHLPRACVSTTAGIGNDRLVNLVEVNGRPSPFDLLAAASPREARQDDHYGTAEARIRLRQAEGPHRHPRHRTHDTCLSKDRSLRLAIHP